MRDMDFERSMQKVADEAQPRAVREAWLNIVRRVEGRKPSEIRFLPRIDVAPGVLARPCMRTHINNGKPTVYAFELPFYAERFSFVSDVPPWVNRRTGKARKVKP